MNKFVKLLLDLIFPPKCAVCGEITEGGGALCGECLAKYAEESGHRSAEAKIFDGQTIYDVEDEIEVLFG